MKEYKDVVLGPTYSRCSVSASRFCVFISLSLCLCPLLSLLIENLCLVKLNRAVLELRFFYMAEFHEEKKML